MVNHGNMDGGSFIFELDGVRWVVDPGNQSYHELEKTGFDLWGRCQDCERWTLLTKNNYGHSTLTINGELHRTEGLVTISDFKTGARPEATFDMTPTLAGQVKKEFARHAQEIGEADSILVMACGLGIQTVAESDSGGEKPVHVGCDTLFMGEVTRKGILLERCSACGECILEETGGICALTRCPKGLTDGPCGGQDKGKCEVEKDRDCVWTLIYNALKEQKRLYLLKDLHLPKDYSTMSKPRKLTLPAGQ